MSILISKTGLTGNIKKIMETPKGYFINGQYYLKGDLSPIPFTNYNASSTFTKVSSLNKILNSSISTNASTVSSVDPGYNENVDHILIDNVDKNISYIITKSVLGFTLLKVIEADGNFIVMKEYPFTTTEYMSFNGFLYQDSRYVYFLVNTIPSSSSPYAVQYIEIKRFDKIAFTVTNVTSFTIGSSYGYKYTKLADSLIFKKMNNLSSIEILQNGTVKSIIASLPLASSQFSVTPYVIENENEYIVYLISSSTTRLDVYTIKKQDLTYAIQSFDLVGFSLGSTSRSLTQIFLLSDGKLCIATSGTSSAVMSGSISILEKSGNVYNCLSSLSIASSTQGMISNKSNSLFIFNINNGASILGYKYNPLTSSFDEEINIKSKVNSIGFDLDENIIIDYDNGDLEIIKNFDIEKINIILENKNIVFDNQSLTEGIKVSVTNDIEEFIEKNIVLKIIGDATFSNMTKEIQVTTLSSGQLEVPITINSYGNLSISGFFVD